MDKRFLKVEYRHRNETSTNYYADKLIKDIREADLLDVPKECNIKDVVVASINQSEHVYIYFDDKMNLLCIAGVTLPDLDITGRQIWMLATKYVYEYKKEILIKESRKLIREWVDRYLLLTNMVNVINTTSIRWLEHFGAVFLPDTVQVGSAVFKEFYIAKERGAKNV